MKYDYLIIGSGLFGATFAYLAKQKGKRCLVIDKRSHLGGNIYCDNIEGMFTDMVPIYSIQAINKCGIL